MVAVYIILWIVSGLIGGGFLFSMFQKSYPSVAAENFRHDLAVFLLLGFIGGPGTLIVGFFYSGFGEHGCWFWGIHEGNR